MLRIFVIIFMMLVVVSCKKSTTESGAVSLMIINAVPDSRPLAVSFNGTGPVRFIDTKKLSYGSFTAFNNRFDLSPGAQLLGMYEYPDTLAKDKPLYDFNIRLTENSINTLFLTGSVQEPDSLLIEEQIPVFMPADSSLGMRFINLMKGSTPVAVNQAGEATGTTAASLAYKSATAFLKFEVKPAISSYVFEFREAASGNFLASFEATEISGSFNFNAWLRRNFTLAIIGKPGGIGVEAPQLLLIKHAH